LIINEGQMKSVLNVMPSPITLKF